MGNHDLGSGASQTLSCVVFCDPIARKSHSLGQSCELHRTAERVANGRAVRHGNKVQNRQTHGMSQRPFHDFSLVPQHRVIVMRWLVELYLQMGAESGGRDLPFFPFSSLHS